MENQSQRTLGVVPLTFFAIGTTLASGVFSLSGDFAASGAYTLAVLIGWVICGVGMLGLTMCFFNLSVVKPELTSGIYTYASEGFGDFLGFNSAWGYWISALLAQLSFVSLLFASLGHFFSVFGTGSNLPSMIVASIIVWALSYLVYRGVNEAVLLNTIVVIAKIIPILVMVVAIVLSRAFSMEIFMENFRGVPDGLSILDQVKATVYTTVWIFIGIEGAVVLSGRGKTTKVSGIATILSFVSLFILYLIISVLSMGVMSQEQLAALGNPPMAGVLEHVVGPWGATLVNLAVIISLGGAMYTYTILCVDSIYGPAKEGAFPRVFAKLNKFQSPKWSILASVIFIQIFIVIIYFNESTYQAVYSMSTSAIMIPYVFSAFYYLKLMIQGQGTVGNMKKITSWLIAIVGSVYGVWLLYASGVEYILISMLLYAPGIIFYIYNRREKKLKLFNNTLDIVLCIGLIVAAVVAIIMVQNGSIQPF